ncbi:MATE family efflux transporter [Pseudodesulfovibrio senegalensis]|nr:MATE family efflux transporter [Pseudodesulfovibrio senegalensis]
MNRIMHRLHNRWKARGGYREALNIGMPLVVSMASTTVMMFTDRVFLGRYSVDAIAAAFPASIAYFLFYSFFLGTIEYVSVFVAQYTGAGRTDRVGAAMWQGVYFCIPATIILAVLGMVCGDIFALVGHDPALREMETAYFRTVAMGSGFGLVGVALSCFYSGRGITKPVMVVNMIAATVNIPLDYMLINGKWIFPEMGITGAALATVAAYVVTFVLLVKLVFTTDHNKRFNVFSGWRFDRSLFGRFMRFGLPGGIQFFLDMFAISFFGVMVGKFTLVELAASNMAISVDTLAFLPAIGMSIAVSVMVGQAMGSNNLRRAEYALKSVLHLVLLYMGGMGLVFVLAPEFLLGLFRANGMSDAEFAPILALGVVLMRYVALFTLMDALAIVYMGGLKGAGDTRFIMWGIGCSSLGVMVVPLILLYNFTDMNIHGPWLCLLLYVMVLSGLFVWRFRTGVWKRLRVIDSADVVKTGSA